MSVVMEQHEVWKAARARLDGGNNRVRTNKVITLKTVISGRTQQVVRISPQVPLPTAAAPREKPVAGRRPPPLPEQVHRQVSAILSFICRKHIVSIAALKSPQRFYHVNRARQEAYYLLLTEGALSSPQVGRVLGGKHHTTVLHGAKMFARREGRAMP